MDQAERRKNIEKQSNDLSFWLEHVNGFIGGDLGNERNLEQALAFCRLAMESLANLYEGLESESKLLSSDSEMLIVTDKQTMDGIARLAEQSGADKDKIVRAGISTLLMTSQAMAEKMSGMRGNPSSGLADLIRRNMEDN